MQQTGTIRLKALKDQDWFEMPNIRRRQYSKSVWVPLRANQRIESSGDPSKEGFREEYFGVGSVVFSTTSRIKSENMEWSDIGVSNNYTGGLESEYITPGYKDETEEVFKVNIPFSRFGLTVNLVSQRPYTGTVETNLPAGGYKDYQSKEIGFGLVIDQYINSTERPIWHLHQDFVIALGLISEGDTWLRPAEGYLDVAKLHRDDEGEPHLLEVRNEHLRDYLCARNSNLYVSSYRSRVEICNSRTHINWDPLPVAEKSELVEWEGRITGIHEGSMGLGDEMAVFHVSRNDVDEEEDVPSFGFPTEESVKSESWVVPASGKLLYRINGELWRKETIERSELSERILGNTPPSTVEFIVDAEGNTRTKATFDFSESRWLWFKPSVIETILGVRGSSLAWYTRYTGAVGLIPGSFVHFGINSIGLINVFAKDIFSLPNWEQKIWAGFNAAPNGKVCEELLASQMKAKPAATKAPEDLLKRACDDVNAEFSRITGERLFRQHKIFDELFRKSHRFRALDRDGLFELAKDLYRLTVESINSAALTKLVKTPSGSNPGTIKHLEKALATKISSNIAREVTAVFVGINELRQADAHLPSSNLDASMKLAGIHGTGNSIDEAQQMLDALVDSLHSITETLKHTN